MTIEQARQCRVVWEAKGLSLCQHQTVENEFYPTGEPTGSLVCSTCGDYMGEGLENFSES